LSEQNASLQKVLREIRKQSEVDFIIKTTQIRRSKPVSVHVKNKPLDEVLKQIFVDQPVDYMVDNQTIIILDKKIPPVEPTISIPKVVQQQVVSGRITTADSEPLAGVSITEKGTSNATLTNDDGQFSLHVAKAP